MQTSLHSLQALDTGFFFFLIWIILFDIFALCCPQTLDKWWNYLSWNLFFYSSFKPDLHHYLRNGLVDSVLPRISNKYSCYSKKSLLLLAQKMKTGRRKGLWRHLWPERTPCSCVGSRWLPAMGSLQIKTALQSPVPPPSHYTEWWFIPEPFPKLLFVITGSTSASLSKAKVQKLAEVHSLNFRHLRQKTGVDLHPQLQRIVRISWLLLHQALWAGLPAPHI